MVDAIFEGNHDAHGWMVMTANLKGRECINALFPRARIAWRDPGGSTDRGAARGPPDTCQARAGRVLPTPSSLQAWRGETTSGSSWSPTVRPVISGRIVDMRVLRKMNVASMPNVGGRTNRVIALQCAIRGECGSLSLGQELLRPRAGGGYRFVSVQPASNLRDQHAHLTNDDAGPLCLLRHLGQHQTIALVRLSGRQDLEEMAVASGSSASAPLGLTE